MTLLNREKLLKKETLKVERVEFDDGDFVYVRQMTGRERDLFERSLMREVKDNRGRTAGFEQSLNDFRAKLAVVTVCDAEGNMLLRPSDVETLSQNMSAYNLERIVNVAQRLNRITEEDKDALVKNSAAGLAGNSSSDSV